MSDVLTNEEKLKATYDVVTIKERIKSVEEELKKDYAHKSYIRQKIEDIMFDFKHLKYFMEDKDE